MPVLLIIDTSFQKATVAFSSNGKIIEFEQSNQQKDHSSFLQPAIEEISKKTGISLTEINAVAVANGPGSYTGLRVGLSSAKAICYALQKPLILLNNLDVIAYSIKELYGSNYSHFLICPMIDARRMEVFTALYTSHLNLIKNYQSVILSNDFLKDEVAEHIVLTGGNGSNKLKTFSEGKNLVFTDEDISLTAVVSMAETAFLNNDFASVAYSEPFYIKPVYIR